MNKMLNISYRENHRPDYNLAESLVLILILSISVPPEEGVVTFQKRRNIDYLWSNSSTAEIYHF